MPKYVLETDLESLLSIVGRFPNGASLEDLQPIAGLARRTLQRRLSVLVARGRLNTIGAARALVYRLKSLTVTPETTSATTVAKGLTVENDVILSPESQQIRAYVRSPFLKRRPVSYKIEFLEAYTPNVTWYLPESLRNDLHVMGRPTADDEDAPAGTFAREILGRLLIDLSWASSHLEGNTYTWLDTERLIEHGIAATGKDVRETQMVLNHKAAIEYLVNNAESIAVNPDTIITLHALLSDGLMPDPMASGVLRKRPVGINGTVYRPLAVPQSIAEIFRLMLEMADEIQDPFEQSFFLMVHLPYLQPFEDVNKRVSRLAANIPLIKANLSPLSFLDVPQRMYVDGILGVYELNQPEMLRDVFVAAYGRSCHQYAATKGEMISPDPFRMRYRTALGDVIRTIIQTDAPASEERIRHFMPAAVAHEDHDAFVNLVLQEFKSLHAGNSIRFKVHPFEFGAWNRREEAALVENTINHHGRKPTDA